jgi:hypothetical protein
MTEDNLEMPPQWIEPSTNEDEEIPLPITEEANFGT